MTSAPIPSLLADTLALTARFNGFDGTSGDLDPATAAEVARRDEVLAPSYRLFYRKPLHLVSGNGAYLYDVRGEEYLDMYNNIPGVGHCNPRVADAVHAQMLQVNTHTRYVHASITDYGERLVATMPASLDRVMFTNSGSESNDLAVRIAQKHTGAQGIIVTENAYHGSTAIGDAISPVTRGGAPSAAAPWVRSVRAPDPYRDGDHAAALFEEGVRTAITELRASEFGFAGFIADMILSTDGVIADPRGLFQPVAEAVREAGGVFIADEVQSGFGRLGESLWGFERHGIVPDIVTMGKPMGNGYPVSALVGSFDVLFSFGKDVAYFSTFGGSPAAMAAAGAVLDEIEDRDLVAHAARAGRRLLEGMRAAAQFDPFIGDVRGAGLFAAVEYVTDRELKTPNPDRALEVVARLRDLNVLISNTGLHNNSLKVRPPLVIDERGIECFLEAFTIVSREATA